MRNVFELASMPTNHERNSPNPIPRHQRIPPISCHGEGVLQPLRNLLQVPMLANMRSLR